MKKTDDIAIEIKNVSKEFVLPQSKNSSIKHAFVNIVKRNNKTVQKVLDGVSFNINKGDFFGIVGRNGSGKSTLLKILAGVYTPTSGAVKINGKLTPFIELGVGFNPELSGRDNVFLNGALLGFTHDEMASMYDEIVEFAELEPFMDQKLKNYSSGMQVRLAFSVAIKARNEIMIFDEVLAVGDEAFQRKCLDVFEEYKRSGQTVVLVTHDMETVRQFCNRAILIHDGKIILDGDPKLVSQRYTDINQQSMRLTADEQKTDEYGLNAVYADTEGERKNIFIVDETMRVLVGWKSSPKVKSVVVNIYKLSGEHVVGYKSSTAGVIIKKGQKEIGIEIGLNIKPGKYHLVLQLLDDQDNNLEINTKGPQFLISEVPTGWSGLTCLPYKWL